MYTCIINPRLIHAETSDQFVDSLFLLELHLMEEAVDHIYNYIEECEDENDVAKVSIILNILKKVQNNDYRKILKNYDKYNFSPLHSSV